MPVQCPREMDRPFQGNLPQITEHQSPDFFHKFTVHFALAPVVLHPRQNGAGNLEIVY